jgi:hypothetical protein
MMTPELLASLPRAETPAGDLAGELPTAAYLGDLARDPRGGRGRRELTRGDYEEMTAALAAGATATELQERFGIGWERARRIWRAHYQREES